MQEVVDRTAKRILMGLDPLYMSLSEQEKSDFRGELGCTLELEIYDKIIDALGVTASAANADPETNHLINRIYSEVAGVGVDRFVMNEANSIDLRRFPTVEDYNLEQDRITKEMMRAHGITPTKTDPRFLENMSLWARAYLNNKFSYITIESIHECTYRYMEELLEEELGRLIPHAYIEGPNHGMFSEGGLARWDIELKADGKEELLMELKAFIVGDLAPTIAQLVAEEECSKSPIVYWATMPDHHYTNNPHYHLVFNSAEAAKKVTFENITQDCNSLGQLSYGVISRFYKKKYSVYAIEELRKEYKRLMVKHKPNVVSFPKGLNINP